MTTDPLVAPAEPVTDPLGDASPPSSADRRNDGPAKAPCRHCAHAKDAHEHHRRGTDCSQSGCGCLKWGRVFPGLHHA